MGLNLDIPGIGNNGKKKKKRKGASPKPRWWSIVRDQDFKCKYFNVKYKCHNKFDKKSGLEPEIHHKDGNSGNNKKSNLIALCRNCHGKVRHAKLRDKKEKGKGKKSKRDDSKIRYDISIK